MKKIVPKITEKMKDITSPLAVKIGNWKLRIRDMLSGMLPL